MKKTQSVSFAISHIDFGWRHAYNSQNSHLSYHCWNMPREPSNQGLFDSLFAGLWSNLCTGAAWVISANLCLRAKCAGPVLSIVLVFFPSTIPALCCWTMWFFKVWFVHIMWTALVVWYKLVCTMWTTLVMWYNVWNVWYNLLVCSGSHTHYVDKHGHAYY